MFSKENKDVDFHRNRRECSVSYLSLFKLPQGKWEEESLRVSLLDCTLLGDYVADKWDIIPMLSGQLPVVMHAIVVGFVLASKWKEDGTIRICGCIVCFAKEMRDPRKDAHLPGFHRNVKSRLKARLPMRFLSLTLNSKSRDRLDGSKVSAWVEGLRKRSSA